MPQYILREFKVTDARVSVGAGRVARLRPRDVAGVGMDGPRRWGWTPSEGWTLRVGMGMDPGGGPCALTPDPGPLPAQDGQSRTVRQFQFTDWPEQGVPKSGEGFIDFIGQVHKTKEQFGQDGPISVHCRCAPAWRPGAGPEAGAGLRSGGQGRRPGAGLRSEGRGSARVGGAGGPGAGLRSGGRGWGPGAGLRSGGRGDTGGPGQAELTAARPAAPAWAGRACSSP